MPLEPKKKRHAYSKEENQDLRNAVYVRKDAFCLKVQRILANMHRLLVPASYPRGPYKVEEYLFYAAMKKY